MENWTSRILDGRTSDDIVDQFGQLAKSYVPEWSFDAMQPDVGGVLACIFANQTYQTLGRYNGVFERYHQEFVNMLGINLLPATPSFGVATMDLLSSTVEGAHVPKGTKLVSRETDNRGHLLVFESIEDLYVTNAQLSDVLEISQKHGKICYHQGDLAVAQPIPGIAAKPLEQEENPYQLFRFRENCVEENGLVICHSCICGDPTQTVAIGFYGAKQAQVVRMLADSDKFTIYRYNNQLEPVEDVKVVNDTLQFSAGECTPLTIDDMEYGMIYIKANGPITQSIRVEDLRIAVEGSHLEPDFLGSNEQSYGEAEFSVFGNQLDLYDEFYLGSNSTFAKGGATVELNFDLSFREREMGSSSDDVGFDLKPIRKKPKNVLQSQQYKSCVDEVEIAYYNGIGWSPMPELLSYKTLFTGEVSGQMSLRFQCPDNWKDITAASFAGKLLRFRVLRADNCYMMPCVHTMPMMKNVKLSYDYGDSWLLPQRVQTICGTQTKDHGKDLDNKKPFDIFSPLPYGGEGLYLGFDRRFEGGPISILFQLQRTGRFAGLPLRYEYSNGQGFTPLKLVDNTNGLQRAGTMQFMPPADFSAVEVEGVSRHWLRILIDGVTTDDYRPVVEQILLNGVQVQNVETLPEESFYLDEVAPNMEFTMGVDNILNAQVYVNEMRFLSGMEMEGLLQNSPERVRVEYDFLGQINRFYVLWQEVSDFRSSNASDRHYTLDRMIGTITFGDGVHGKIPSERQDAAFDVTLRRCSGSMGNLPPDSITEALGGILYINGVTNPMATYGGSNLESLPHAYARGADIVSSRNRLVSQQDYIRCASAFSDNIAQVACLLNRDLAGNQCPGHVLLLLLMRDCCEGAPSFTSVQDGLRRKMMENCELTCGYENLEIAEPIYVQINVEIWLVLEESNGAFDIQMEMKQLIERYIQPVPMDINDKGWHIGQLPQEKNLSLLLQGVRFQGRIRHMIATATYYDHLGEHHCSLDDLKGNPVMIGLSGIHKIHMELPIEGG